MMEQDTTDQQNSLEFENTTETPIDIDDYFNDLTADIEGPTTPFIILCKFVILHYDINTQRQT